MMQWCRKVKNIGGPVVIGGDNLPSLVRIGLSDLQNIGGLQATADRKIQLIKLDISNETIAKFKCR